MLFLLRLDRGTFAFATASVIVVAAMGTVAILVYPQSSLNDGTISGLVAYYMGGPQVPPGHCSNQTLALPPYFESPVAISAQPQSSPGTSINIPILDWTSDCVNGARVAYGSIRFILIPGEYTLRLNCTGVCNSLITIPSGETHQAQGYTFSLQVMSNKTTTMDINVWSLIY